MERSQTPGSDVSRIFSEWRIDQIANNLRDHSVPLLELRGVEIKVERQWPTHLNSEVLLVVPSLHHKLTSGQIGMPLRS